jgi:hypothetical protein
MADMENEPGSAGYGEPKDHAPNTRPPSGGKAKGASAEHMAPPVLHLEAHHIAKLFKNKMPPVGSKIKFNAVAHVGAYNEGADGPPSGGKAKGGEGNTGRTMALHFHKMDAAQDNQGGEQTVDQAAESAKGAKAEMDKALAREAGGGGKNAKMRKDGEGEEGTEAADNAPRGTNGPGAKAMRIQK